MNNIGSRIKEMRKRKNLSLTELAQNANVAKSYLSNVERGIQNNPSIQFIEKIASALHIPVNSLIFGEEEANQQLDLEWTLLLREAIASGVDKNQFKEFLEYQIWKRNQE